MHSGLLSWSAIETDQTVDLRAIVDARVAVGLRGGRELIALGRSVRSNRGRDALDQVASCFGIEAAIDAVGIVAAFELVNRVVDATGLPIGRHAREQNVPVIDTLGADRFPHAGH